MKDWQTIWTEEYGKGTNSVCEAYIEPYDYCGCARCGHSKGEHRPMEATLMVRPL